MSIRVTSSGNFKRTEKFLKKMSRNDIFSVLSHYGEQGVRALASSTPSESGVTAGSWSYEITKRRNVYSISWLNNYGVNGVPIVILLQYGHSTGTGGYVQGRDFINPAIKPIFDQIAESVWKAVTSA